METMRRYGAGRLAEIFGTQAVGDRHGRCGCSASTAPAEAVILLTCPRRCTARSKPMPPASTRFWRRAAARCRRNSSCCALRPEPWRPADSLVWGKLMDLELDRQLPRRIAAGPAGPHVCRAEQLAFLYPEYPKEAPTTLAELAPIYRRLPLDPLYAGLAADHRPDLRLEQLGRRRRAQRERQAVAGQRPASRFCRSGRLVSGAAQDAGARDRRRHGAGRAACRDRPQRPDRLGLYDDGQRCRGPFYRKARSERSRTLSDPGRQRAVRDPAGDDRGARRGAGRR